MKISKTLVLVYMTFSVSTSVLFGQDSGLRSTIVALKQREANIKDNIEHAIVPFEINLVQPSFYKSEEYSKPSGCGLFYIDPASFGYTVHYTYPSVPKYSAENSNVYSEQDYDAIGRLIVSRTKIREGSFAEKPCILFVAENYAISPDNSVVSLPDTETLIKVNDYQDDLFMLWLLSSCSVEITNWVDASSTTDKLSTETTVKGHFGKNWTGGQWSLNVDETNSLIRRAEFSTARGMHLFTLNTTGSMSIQGMSIPIEAQVKTTDSTAEFVFKENSSLPKDQIVTLSAVTKHILADRAHGAVIIDQSEDKDTYQIDK